MLFLFPFLFLFISAVGNIIFVETVTRGNNDDDEEKVVQNYNWPRFL